MKKKLYRAFVWLVTVAFVNFVFANTVFVHTHSGIGGRMVTHSHPVLPSAPHGHSAAAFGAIADFNAAAQLLETSSATVLQAPADHVERIAPEAVREALFAILRPTSHRGPPTVMI